MAAITAGTLRAPNHDASPAAATRREYSAEGRSISLTASEKAKEGMRQYLI